jgi:hypothetical protein
VDVGRDDVVEGGTSISPPARAWISVDLTYDAARGKVVLFSGSGDPGLLDDTWTWDGTTWTEEHPPRSPLARYGLAMAYDAARSNVVMFGGSPYVSDTWTWDGTDWAVPLRASATLRPRSGPPGTVVHVQGWGFGALEKVQLTFIDSTKGIRKLGMTSTDATGAFAAVVRIPKAATPGDQLVKAKGRGSGQVKRKTFTVT